MRRDDSMRHVLITGGTQGIGQKVAETFIENGYSATLNFRSNQESAEQFIKNHAKNKERIQILKADITNLEAVNELVDTVFEKWGRIDVIINCAGPFVFERKPIIEHDPEEWEQMIKGNLSSVFYLLKKIVPIMRAQRFGRIITFGFQNAGDATAWMDHGPFAAAKVGLVSLVKTLAIEEAAYGITANMVCPGIILPDMKTASIAEAEMQEGQRTPFGRSVSGEDLARTIAFLCEEKSQMISGTIMDLTGGVDVINRFRPVYNLKTKKADGKF